MSSARQCKLHVPSLLKHSSSNVADLQECMCLHFRLENYFTILCCVVEKNVSILL